MNMIFAQLKKDFRLNKTLLLTLWALLAFSMVLPLNSVLSNSGYGYLLQALPILTYIFTASIYAQDGSSDIHAFWRMRSISALQISLAKFALVFIFIIVPVVTVHWFSLQRLSINLPHVQVVEPLAWFTLVSLAIGLLGAVCGAYRAKFILFFVVVFWLLSIISIWASSRVGIGIPSYEGMWSIVILVSVIALLLAAHWACYLRQGFKFQITIAATTLLVTWFASAISGAWFYTVYSTQPLEVLGIDNLTNNQVSLYRYESHSFDETETVLFAKIRLPKQVQENFIITSLTRLSGAEIYRIHRGAHSGFDRGVFNLAHTKLGFAANQDRKFENPIVELARIKEQHSSLMKQSPTDVNIGINFIEPQITIVADIPFKGGAEITFRDQVFKISTKVFNNSSFVISLKGVFFRDTSKVYSPNELMMNVVLYNPILKEISLTREGGGSRSTVRPYLNRPQLRNIRAEWKLNTWAMPHKRWKSSTGYTIISKPPSKEWLEEARIKVYKTDLSVPVTRTLKFDRVDLADLPLYQQ